MPVTLRCILHCKYSPKQNIPSFPEKRKRWEAIGRKEYLLSLKILIFFSSLLHSVKKICSTSFGLSVYYNWLDFESSPGPVLNRWQSFFVRLSKRSIINVSQGSYNMCIWDRVNSDCIGMWVTWGLSVCYCGDLSRKFSCQTFRLKLFKCVSKSVSNSNTMLHI